MGSLDDAIREHLELKRKHGADEDELKELEDSAFGPPERPGAADGEGQAAPPGVADADPPAAETTLMPLDGDSGAEPVSGEQAAAVSQPAAGPEARVADTGPETAREPELSAGAGVADEELSPAEQAREDYPNLDDTIAHEPIAPPEKVQSTEEQDALEISLFESEDDEEDFDIGEVDLGLREDEQAEVEPFEPETEDPVLEAESDEMPAEAVEESAREHGVIAPHEPPIAESVVDPDPTDDAGMVEEVEDVEMPDGAPSDQQIVDPDPTEGDHDVLEETPEFLRDAPESDEMWFEQDQPKDFDFDD